MSDRVAAVDCGTNSIRLLIADARGGALADGALVDVVREMRVVRLGQDVDRTGRLAPEALERTRLALVDYAATIRSLDVGAVRMVATSATRDAANRDEFTAMVLDVLGVAPQVIAGSEEAALSFAGAAAGLPGAVAPMLVADIGGGSTELVLGTPGGPLAAHSMDVGCVRMTERRLPDDPPGPDQVEAVEADVRAALAVAARDVPLAGAATVVGVAGTVTTVAALALGLARYDSAAIHGARVTRGQVEDVTAALLALSRSERAALPVMHPGRVDVICAGALILRTVLRATGADSLTASEHDILDGIALSLL